LCENFNKIKKNINNYFYYNNKIFEIKNGLKILVNKENEIYEYNDGNWNKIS